MAISLVGDHPAHFETAAQVAVILFKQILKKPLPENTILNVNVPDLPFSELKGFKACRLGQRHKSEPIIKSEDQRGRRIYWVGAAGEEQDAGEGTDFHAINNGYVSITPLQLDLTWHERITNLETWLPECIEL